MSAKRRATLGCLGALVFVAAALVALGALVHGGLRRGLERACGAVLGGHCEVGALQLSRRGAVAGPIRGRTPEGTETLRADELAVDLSWWALVTGRVQGIHVRLTGPVLLDAGALDGLVRVLLALEAGRDATGKVLRVRMDAFTLGRGTFETQLAPFVTFRVDGITAAWRRGGTLDAGWQESSVSLGPFDAVRSGRCAIHAPPGREATLDCGGVLRSIELGPGVRLAQALASALRAARPR